MGRESLSLLVNVSDVKQQTDMFLFALTFEVM